MQITRERELATWPRQLEHLLNHGPARRVFCGVKTTTVQDAPFTLGPARIRTLASHTLHLVTSTSASFGAIP